MHKLTYYTRTIFHNYVQTIYRTNCQTQKIPHQQYINNFWINSRKSRERDRATNKTNNYIYTQYNLEFTVAGKNCLKMVSEISFGSNSSSYEH